MFTVHTPFCRDTFFDTELKAVKSAIKRSKYAETVVYRSDSDSIIGRYLDGREVNRAT